MRLLAVAMIIYTISQLPTYTLGYRGVARYPGVDVARRVDSGTGTDAVHKIAHSY